MQHQKRVEAEKHVEKAREKTTKGLFRWSKDYAGAASDYDRALACYKVAKDWPACLQVLDRLYHCNDKLNDQWAKARNLQNKLELVIDHDLSPPAEVFELGCKAIQGLAVAGGVSEGVMLATKAEKALAKSEPDLAGKLVAEAMRLLQDIESDSTYDQEQLLFLRVGRLLESGQAEQAAGLYWQRLTTPGKGKFNFEQYSLSYILLLIIANQPKLAEDRFSQLIVLKEGKEFISSSEYECADKLLTAFQKGDQAAFAKWQARPAISGMFPAAIPRALKKVSLVAPQEESEQARRQRLDEMVL